MSQFCFLEVYLEKAITTETNTGQVHEGKRRQVRRSTDLPPHVEV